MKKRSQIFFEQFEKKIQVANFLSITGSKESLYDFLETQLFNGERKITKSLTKFDINTMSLRNYRYDKDIQPDSFMILCDEATILKNNNKTYTLSVNFNTVNGMRQKLIEDLSLHYPTLIFQNNFFNIEHDYCGQIICKSGEANYYSYDSFHDRFGFSLHSIVTHSSLSLDRFIVEMPVSSVHHLNPFDFDTDPVHATYNMQFTLNSIDLLELIVTSFQNPELNQSFLERMENSPFKMLRFLKRSGFKICFSQSDEQPFSLIDDKIRGLAYFYSILQFYIQNRDFLQSCYTSLILEKNYQARENA